MDPVEKLVSGCSGRKLGNTIHESCMPYIHPQGAAFGIAVLRKSSVRITSRFLSPVPSAERGIALPEHGETAAARVD